MVGIMARAHALGSRRGTLAAQAALLGGSMDQLEIARWQFGITTVYHFLMVPLTIGLGLRRRRDPDACGTAPGEDRNTCG